MDLVSEAFYKLIVVDNDNDYLRISESDFSKLRFATT